MSQQSKKDILFSSQIEPNSRSNIKSILKAEGERSEHNLNDNLTSFVENNVSSEIKPVSQE